VIIGWLVLNSWITRIIRSNTTAIFKKY
jgi:hypothetical protein